MTTTEQEKEWRKEKTTRYGLRFMNSSGIPDTLKQMSDDTGKSEITIIREAILEKINCDGYTVTPHKQTESDEQIRTI